MNVNAVLQKCATRCHVLYDIFSKCGWVSTSWQRSVNCTKIENKQLYTWGETIQKNNTKTHHTHN